MVKKFEDYAIGDHAEFEHLVTWEDIQKFAEITGDDNRLHVDREFASRTSFKGIVAHGMLSASFVSRIIGKYLPGDGALCMSQQFQFLLPVRPNDTLTVVAEVIKKNASTQLLTLKTIISNQHKQVVLNGEANVKILDYEEVTVAKVSDVRQQVVLVTGSSRGIGAETARLLGRNSYQVIINYSSDKQGAEEVCDMIFSHGGHAIALKADVADGYQVEAMFRTIQGKFGTLTGLVNNASPKLIALPFDKTDWSNFQRHLNVQIGGAYNCIRQALPMFLHSKYGSVVNISDIATDHPPPNWASYVTAKSALLGLTKSLATEYGPKKIRFNVVSPGMTDTSMISEIPEKTRLLLAMQTPLRSIAKPTDIAETIEFLLSDRSKHITGEVIRICGGAAMR